MKIVLRHKSTGRYYSAPHKWVRRSDNALAFEDLIAAQQFLEAHHLGQTQTVYRLAPYLMPLLRQLHCSLWDSWAQSHRSRWYLEQGSKFDRN
jgi:hypothetical protein